MFGSNPYGSPYAEDDGFQEILRALAEQHGGDEEAAITALLGSGMLDESEALLEKQMGIAEALRKTPTPEGRQVGGVFVAANPLEMIGSALARQKGERDLEGLMGENRELIEGTKTGAKDFLRAYLEALRGKDPGLAGGGSSGWGV